MGKGRKRERRTHRTQAESLGQTARQKHSPDPGLVSSPVVEMSRVCLHTAPSFLNIYVFLFVVLVIVISIAVIDVFVVG